MDEICSHLLVGNWTPPGGTRRRRSVDAAPGRVSLLSLFIAAHNESVLAPATTTAVTPTTHLNVTATPSPVSLVAAMFGDSVTRGLLPAVTVLVLFANSLTLVVIAGDRRCPALWRALRCLAVVVDVVLLTLLTLVIDVVAYFAHMSLDVLNSLAAVTGLCQFAQPWILYITATYIHCLLLDERHKVPPRRRVRCPLAQLIVMLVVGTVYFTLYVPPIRLLLYTNIPSHSTLCTLPLFDQWQLTVGQTAATDLFYYLCYDCTYALLVYLAPIVPLYYRYRRLVDAVFRRDYKSIVVRTSLSLGSWVALVLRQLGGSWVWLVTGQLGRSSTLALVTGWLLGGSGHLAG